MEFIDKFSILKWERIIKKFYELCVYESIDDKSLSLSLTQNLKKKKNPTTNGLKKEKFHLLNWYTSIGIM